MKICKDCKAPCTQTRCDGCRPAFNKAEAAKRSACVTGRRNKCQRCFLTGHNAVTCTWEPSIFASYKTPKQAAEETVSA